MEDLNIFKKKNTIAIVFHDTELSSGATRSMIDIVDSWIADEAFSLVAIFPSTLGTAIDYLQAKGVTIVSSYFILNDVLYPRTIRQTLGYPKRTYKWLKGYYSTVTKLARKLKDLHVDLIYTNTSTTHVGAWVNKSISIPHIWHFREFGEEDHGFTRIWGNLFLYHTISKYTNSLIVISKALKAKVEKRTQVPISVIYDDLSPGYVQEQPNKIFSDRPFRILMVGTLSFGKGHMQAIQSVELLVKKGLHLNLSIAGKGLEREVLEQYVQDKQLGSYITFLGQISDMNALRRTMHLGLVCSRCEAFGRVTIEGMLSSMVMIGSDTGGTPELIEDGETGLLYHWNDVADLAEKIELLYNSDSLMQSISKKGFKSALQYTQGRCAEQCKALIFENLEG
ncbi:MAG TPA: glycosyltransferase family 4 protein [Clostridiales bacterium]|nr:glycosyltransferase family 4 protein [Clostridiales bacterium]